MKKKLENRREFLKKVCPTIAFAFFGLSFLEACSSGDDSENDDSGGNNQNGEGRYFDDLNEVEKAHQNKDINLHTKIFTRIKNFEGSP